MDSPEPISPELAQLLKAARREMPDASSAVVERVLERVQTTVATGGGASSSGGSSGGGVSGGAAVVGKVLALVLVAGAGYMVVANQGASGRMVSSTNPDAAPIASAASLPTASASAEPPVQVAPARAPIEVAPVRAVRSPHRSKRKPAIALDRLGEEEALLEEVRTSLATSPRAALRGIAKHARRFSNGQLAEERELLRARAQAALGNIRAARAVAEKFLEEYPNSMSRREMEKLWKSE